MPADAERTTAPSRACAWPTRRQCGEVHQGRHQAVRVQGLRLRLHAPKRPIGTCMDSRARARAPPTTTSGASPESGRSCEQHAAVANVRRRSSMTETARGKKAKFKDAAITMAHGAGHEERDADPDRGPARPRLGCRGRRDDRRRRRGRR